MDVDCKTRHGPFSIDDIKPTAYPDRRFPSAYWSPKAASDRPRKGVEPQRTSSPRLRRSCLAMPLPPGVFRGRHGDAYCSAVAFRHSFAARINSFRQCASPRQSELMRDAIVANRANRSGRETAATQQNPRNLRWRILVLPNDNGSLRPSRNSGAWEEFPDPLRSPPGSASQRSPSPGPTPCPRAQRTLPELLIRRTAPPRGIVPLATGRIRHSPKYHQCAWR